MNKNKKMMIALGSLEETQKSGRADQVFVGKWIRENQKRWMTAMHAELRRQRIPASANSFATSAENALRKIPDQFSIDLLAHFVLKLNPKTVVEMAMLLVKDRVKNVVVLSHEESNWEEEWTHTLRDIPKGFRGIEKNILMPTEEMMDSKLQFRDLTYFRQYDMRQLITQVMDQRN